MIDENEPSTLQAEPTEPKKPNPINPNGRRMTEEEYEAIYQSWRGGLKSSVSLGLKFGWSDETIRVLLKYGNKRRNWLPFAQREAIATESLRQATTAVAEKIAGRAVDDWEKAKTHDLLLINGSKVMLAGLLKKFQESVNTVDFSKMSGGSACANARALATAIEVLVRAESLLLGKPTERKEITPGDGWDKLNLEQLQYVIDHHGQLPPDMDEGALFPATN